VIRCDNGSDFICGGIQKLAAEWRVKLEHIQPDNPQQNSYLSDSTGRYITIAYHSIIGKNLKRFKTLKRS
jgi:hypothetical protein